MEALNLYPPERGGDVWGQSVSIETLKGKKIWVNWKFDEKRGKVPKNSRTGGGAMSNNANTWSDYATAERVQERFDGIGVMFADGLCGVDIDGVDGHTSDNPLADEVLSLFDGTYVEKSPSGHGFHILFFCDVDRVPTVTEKDGTKSLDKAFYYKSPNSLESYPSGLTNRFFTFTGKMVSKSRYIVDKTEEYLIFLERYMRRSEKKKPSPDTISGGGGLSMSDSAVIEKACAAENGAKFKRLYSGDISDFGSHSEADLALCSLLAFWCNRDAVQVDRIFRSSGLMREKWDERHGSGTYGQMTISEAVKSCTAVYNPAEYRQQQITKTLETFSPESFDSSTHGGQPTSTEPVKSGAWVYEDNGKVKINCPALADFIRENYHYFFAAGDARGLKELYLYQHGVYVLQSDDDFKGFIKKHVPRECYRSKDIDEIFKDLHTDSSGGKHSANIDDLNADEDIINFHNGIYHLSTGKLTPHDPKYLSTIQYDLDYKPISEGHNGGVFDKFITYHLGGDMEQVQLILEFFGVAISNLDASRMKKALFVIGEGNTGKSQLKNLLTRLIGSQHCAPLELSDLEQRFGTSALYQKRLAGCNDMSCMRIEELTTFKKLTGGDVLAAEFKGKPHFSFKFRGLLWFCANELPLFGGDKGKWVYDRIVMVKPVGVAYPLDTPPFEGIVYADPHLQDKLWGEREYIVSRAIAALQGLIRRGYRYNITDTNKRYLADYQTDNSSTLSFFDECCMPRPMRGKYDSCTKARLYQVYVQWCKLNSRHGYYDKRKDFQKALDSIGAGRISTVKGVRYYSEFTLTPDAKQEYSFVYGADSALISE